MTIGELGLNVVVGLLIIISIVAIITIISNILNKTDMKSSDMENIFLGKLSNSDSSIEDAVEFLKLTNGINQLDSKGKN